MPFLCAPGSKMVGCIYSLQQGKGGISGRISYTRRPGGLLCASVNVTYRHALHKQVAFCICFFLKAPASHTETSHNARLLSINLLASGMFQTGVWPFHSFPAPLSPIKYVSYFFFFFCEHVTQTA